MPADRDAEATWVLSGDEQSRLQQRLRESLYCLADGAVGTRGGLEERGDPLVAPVAVADLYETAALVGERLVHLPAWYSLPLASRLGAGRRSLDLRSGTLQRLLEQRGERLETTRFACIGEPGLAVLIAEISDSLLGDIEARLSSPRVTVIPARGERGGAVLAVSTSLSRTDGTVRIERIAAVVSSNKRCPRPARARKKLNRALKRGATALLEEQRALASARWETGDLEVLGDPAMTLTARLALFHLRASSLERGESAIGARGLTGPAYAGHVFWDTDVFVLPVLAAVAPRAARSVLEYRLRRLGRARERARLDGRDGARFPWESAGSGEEVTPLFGINQEGRSVPIENGEREEHITADVAWGAWRYASWLGSWSFLERAGRPLLLDTARYWASRITLDDAGQGHIEGVIGPDEYHPRIDDNAFTNLMVRWNLKMAADLLERRRLGSRSAEETARWRELADHLVDNRDPATGLYEQFRHFHELEPLRASELGQPPFAADFLLGEKRLQASQIIKQADVLMAYFMIEAELPAGSLEENLEHYLPRCSHGSSLSPAVHAALLARAGRPDEAVELLRLAAAIDIDDLTETTAEGLHLANFGAIWQALVHGFGGLQLGGPDDDLLRLEPHLPSDWEGLDLRLLWRGRRLQLSIRPDRVGIVSDAPLTVAHGGAVHELRAPGGWIE